MKLTTAALDENQAAPDFGGRLASPGWAKFPKPPSLATRLLDAVERHDQGLDPGTILIREYPVCPVSGIASPRLDGFSYEIYSGTRIGYEVKISRQDLRTELRNPAKTAAYTAVVDQLYFVTPVGLCSPSELPLGLGLIEIDVDTSQHSICREAAEQKPRPLSKNEIGMLVAHAFRHGQSDASRREQLPGWFDVFLLVENLLSSGDFPWAVRMLFSTAERMRREGRPGEADELKALAASLQPVSAE